MAKEAFKEFDVVRYINPTEIEKEHPEYGTGLDSLYGIVRDTFKNVVYVEFFGKNNKPQNLVPRPVSVLEKVGGMFDIIKKSQAPAKVIVKTVKEPKAKVKADSEEAPKPKRTRKVKEVKPATTEATSTEESATTEATTKLNGLRILPTGLFDHFSRTSFVDSIVNNGGVYGSGGVNKKLDILVVGRAAGPAKIAKAAELGIKMISEEEYLEMIK